MRIPARDLKKSFANTFKTSFKVTGPSTSAASKLLDSVSGVVMAYSSRKLRTAYSGSALRVRRSSDSTELDIGFTTGGDLDTAALATFVGANSAFVSKWYDQSGNANDLIGYLGATSRQPTLVASGTNVTLNSRVCALFDGVDTTGNTMKLAAALAPTTPLATPITQAFLFSPVVVTNHNNQILSSLFNTDSMDVYHDGFTLSALNGSTLAGVEMSASAMTANQIISGAIVWNGASSSSNYNAEAKAYNAGTTPNVASLLLGGNTTTRNFNAKIGEFIVTSSVLSSGQLAAIRASHQTYWGAP